MGDEVDTKEMLRAALVAAFKKYDGERLDAKLADAIREDVEQTVRAHFREHPAPHPLGITAAMYRASGGKTDAPAEWMAWCRGFDVKAERESYTGIAQVEFIPRDVFFRPEWDDDGEDIRARIKRRLENGPAHPTAASVREMSLDELRAKFDRGAFPVDISWDDLMRVRNA